MAAADLSAEEKKKLLLLIAIGGLVILGSNEILFPWIRETAAIAHCHTYAGVNGLALFLAAVLVLTVGPMLGVCIYAFLQSRRAVRHQQFPPPGRYYIRPRRVQHGRIAVVRGYVGMALCGLIVPMILIYGVYRMMPFIKEVAAVEVDAAECAELIGVKGAFIEGAMVRPSEP